MNPQRPLRWSRVSVALLLLLALVTPIVAFAGSSQPARAKIDPAVVAQLSAEKESTVWVILHEKANLAPAYQMKNWEARGRFVAAQLQATANRSQAGVRALLQSRGKAHKAFWIVNAIKVTADGVTLDAVAARPEVAKIVSDQTYKIPEPLPGSPQAGVQSIEWNVDRIRAPEVWSTFATRGEGIVVANIDTGVQYTHPALINQYRGNQNGSFDHAYNWYDPTGLCGGTPCDTDGHGTHTMGTMVGDDGGDNQIGVAPGARWIAVKGCEYNWCSSESLLAAGQWIIAPTDLNGENPRPELRPNIVNNSWGGGRDDPFYQWIVDSWNASGIFPQFSIGNSGPGCASASAPGNFLNSYAAGAFDYGNNIAPFSSRGPSPYANEIKPNIAAPGVDVRSSYWGGYAWLSGTSMASPHVAATVALMWSAAPALVGDIEFTRELLDASAIDVEDTSCDGSYPPPPTDGIDNNIWGEGRLDAFAAVDLSPHGPTGFVRGTVTDNAFMPLSGVEITAAGPSNRATDTDFNGTYSLRLPIGDYTVSTALFGYIGQTANAVVVTEGMTTTVDFALEPAPAYQVAGMVYSSSGAPLANATVTILNTPILPVVTGADGSYAFPSVPQGSYDIRAEQVGCYDPQVQSLAVEGPLSLDFSLPQRSDAFGYFCSVETPNYIDVDTPFDLAGDDAAAALTLPFPFTFYGQTYDTAYVTTNGFVNFLEPNANLGHVPIPDSYPPNAAIYAFWDDLFVDTWQGGAIQTGEVNDANGHGFVIEWENVRFCCVSEENFSMEMILYENGKILLQYRNIDPNNREQGGNATIGIEDENGNIGLQFAYNQPVIAVPEFALLYNLPPSGFVQGSVTDANDQLPISGATVRLLDNGMLAREITTNADGFYRLQVPVGSYEIEITATNYTGVSQAVVIAQDQTVTFDAALETARAAIEPPALEFVVPLGQVRTATLTLSNSGSADLIWELRESGGGMVTTATATGMVRNPAYDPNARTTQGLYLNQEVHGWAPTAPGNVIRSWTPNGLGFAWGVGYTGNVWLSDAPNQRNHEFTVDGTATGRNWPASWGGDWLADMTYDAGRGWMCQVNVGGDNGIHCFDPETGATTGSISGPFPWSAVSQRGMAYRPDDDSFYIGGWNEGIIYHVAGFSHETPGTVLDQCYPPDGAISGLAWNEGANVLWQATNNYEDTIYQLNPTTCAVLSTLPHPNPGYNGGGLEMDEDGNLWMISQYPQTVYLVESGVPAFGDVPWLSESPSSGTLAPGMSQQIEVTINTTGLESGIYHATLFLRNNSGRSQMIRIPISLTAPAYYQTVNAGGKSYTDIVGELWAADKQYSTGSWGYTNAASKASSARKAIAGTNDDPLYQSLRENPVEYRFDGLEPGVYQVDLNFADLSVKRAGIRIFDVYIEGSAVLPAHDIVGEVGPLTADTHTFLVTVNDGQLNIRFAPYGRGYQLPIVNAIRVIHRPER